MYINVKTDIWQEEELGASFSKKFIGLCSNEVSKPKPKSIFIYLSTHFLSNHWHQLLVCPISYTY